MTRRGLKRASYRGLGLALAFFALADPEAVACGPFSACAPRMAAGTADKCCCDNFWGVTAPPYASVDACYCNASSMTTYCTAPVKPPLTCAQAGYLNDPGGLCPSDPRCTGITLGFKPCVCPNAGEYWDGDGCTVGAPPPVGACTGALPSGAAWNTHGCGTGSPNCADSELPIPLPPAGTTFANLTNKMAACCGRGWGENPGSASKLDCVEAVAPAKPTIQSFLDFYNYDGVASSLDLTTGGVSHPNQLFVLDANGVPVNGFYTDTGRRCTYRDPSTKASVSLSPSVQMQLFQEALAGMKVPQGTGHPGGVEVDPLCCNLVVLALERKCPDAGNDSVNGVRLAATEAGTRRCTAATMMKVDSAIFDFCDPTVTKRPRFRVATSFEGEDPTKASISAVVPIQIDLLIHEFYPSLVPLTKPVCPANGTGAVYEVPWTNGMCRLKAPDGPFNYPPSP